MRKKFYVVIDLYPKVYPYVPNIGRIALFHRKRDRDKWKRDNEPGMWVRCETEAEVAD